MWIAVTEQGVYDRKKKEEEGWGHSQGWISVSLSSHREEMARAFGHLWKHTHILTCLSVYTQALKKRQWKERGKRREERKGRERREAKEPKQNEKKEGRQEGGRQRKTEREKKGLSINDSDMNFPARILSALIIYLFPSLTHLRGLNGHYVQFLLRNICVEGD